VTSKRSRIRDHSLVCTGKCHTSAPYAVEVIEATPSHMPWVFRSWQESYHDDGIDLRGARHSSYSGLMTARMQRLVGRSIVLVAVEPDDTDHLFGFVVAAEGRDGVPVVHFVYTKSTRRHHGIAGLLVRAAFVKLCGDSAPSEWHFTDATTLGKHIATRAGHGGRHNAAAAWDEATVRRAG
jgi:hypothetical protein